MNPPLNSAIDYFAPPLVEAIARVVAVSEVRVWLEPEQTSSCGSCATSGSCGAKGMGTTASRLEARRFTLAQPDEPLRVGDRVVVGVPENALVKAALTAYGLPLVLMLGAGVLAAGQGTNSDGFALIAMVAGLALGLVLARRRAKRLSAQGVLAPRYLRRADSTGSCSL